MKRMVNIILTMIFLFSNIEYSHGSILLSPDTRLDDDGFSGSYEKAVELVSEHRGFRGFIRDDVPGYAKTNPSRERLPQVTMHRAEVSVDLPQRSFAFADGFWDILQDNFHGVDIERIKQTVNSVFQYRLNFLPDDSRTFQSNISVLFLSQSHSLFGDYRRNQTAWVNLPALKHLIDQIGDASLKTEILGLALGIGLSHEILGHELGIGGEEILTKQDVDIALTFLYQLVYRGVQFSEDDLSSLLKTTLQRRSLFIKRLENLDLIAEIGFSKIQDYMRKGNRGDLDYMLIPFEAVTGSAGKIRELGVSIGQKYPGGTEIKIVPRKNRNYGWYIEVYVWNEEARTWDSSPVKIFIFEESRGELRLKPLDTRFSIEQREWIDYITEGNTAVDGGVVKPGPYFVKADKIGRIKILDPDIIFTVEVLANKEVRVELFQHPVYGELIYLYDRNKYEWELKEVQKGIQRELSPPAVCYRKTGRGGFERFCRDISFEQKLWIDWLNKEPGQEGFDPPEYVTTGDARGQIWIFSGRMSFSADMLKGKKALVRFVRDSRYKQFNPNGELIFIYDEERYDRESYEIMTGVRREHSLPERAYRKTARGRWESVAEKISFSQLIWLDWMYAQDSASVLRPQEPMLVHVPPSGNITLAHSGDRDIGFSAVTLAGRDAIVKLTADPNFGDVIYIYEAVEYFKEEREIKAGLRQCFSMPSIAYKKTAPGRYERIPRRGRDIKQLSDFAAYVWIQWVHHELNQETVRPIGEYNACCADDGRIYIGDYSGNKLEFYSSDLRSKKVVITLQRHSYYGELVYIYDAERYIREKLEILQGERAELSPPDACYKKEERGRCVSFPRGFSINQKSWLDWWYGETVMPLGDLEAKMGDKNALRVVRQGDKKIEFNVSGLEEGEVVVIRLVNDPEYGELVYIYEKDTLLANPHAPPIQVYRKTAPGVGEPLPGKDWDKLQKLTWLDYLYRKPNIHEVEVKPRGFSIKGRIGNNGRFAFYAGDMKFEFHLKQYAGRYIHILKEENPKFGYVFKVIPEEDRLRRAIAIYVRDPQENRLIRIQDHPDYCQGDENLRPSAEEKIPAAPSREEPVDRLITMAGWIDYWGLRGEFKSLFDELGIRVTSYLTRAEKKHRFLASMGASFISLMRTGLDIGYALSRVIREYMEKAGDYEKADAVFNTELGQDFLDNETVRFVYISDVQAREEHPNMTAYIRQHGYLEKSEIINLNSTDVPGISRHIRTNRPNFVVVDFSDLTHRREKMRLLQEIYDAVPARSFVVVLQRTSEAGYRKTAAQLMEEQGFTVDTFEHTDVQCLVSGFKKEERVTEEDVIAGIADRMRSGLNSKGLHQRDEIIAEIESTLNSVSLEPRGVSKLAAELASANDSALISKLLEYLDYNKNPYNVDRTRYPNMPRVIAPGEIEFVFYAPPGSEVLVAGDFTHWSHSPILLRPKGQIGPDGLQRYSARVSNLYGTHYFKYIVNGQWYEDLDSVSPYKETSTHHGHAVTNSVVWSARSAYNPFIRTLAYCLAEKLTDETISPDIKKQIASMLPLQLLSTGFLRKPENAKILIKYTLSNIEGLSIGAIAIQLELILKYFNLSDEDLSRLGHELAEEATDIGLFYFLLDYLRYNTTPYEIDRARYYQAPIAHELGKVEFVCYSEEGAQVVLTGDFTAWHDKPIPLSPNPQERRDGLVKYSVTVSDLHGPHLFKFMIKRPFERELHWYWDVGLITPYIKEGAYRARNCVVWTSRGKGDPFIKGLASGFLERTRSPGTQDFHKYLIIENFPLMNYPELSGEVSETKTRVNKQLWLSGRFARGPPIDTLQAEPVLYVSLRNFTDSGRGLNGINGFIEWYRSYLAQHLPSGRKTFSAVMFLPPFEIGEEHKLGSWGSPWSTKSFDNIDSRIGTKEELIAGIKRLREEFGLNVLFDIVLHSTSRDSAILEEHPDWGMPRTGAWVTDWVDITPLDLRKSEVRDYMLRQLIKMKETFGIDGFRIDGVSQTSVFLLSAYEQWTRELRRRYPDILLVAEGRDPFLWNTAHVVYDWDICFALKKCLEARGNVYGFHSTIQRKQGSRNYERRGVLLAFSKTQDSKFEMGRPNTVKAILFALPETTPAIWMPQICDGEVVGERESRDRDRQIKFSGWKVTGPTGELEYVKRLVEARVSNPAFAFGSIEEVTLAHCHAPQEVIAFRRSFGPNTVCVIGGLTNAHYKMNLCLPFTNIDISDDPSGQRYWVGNLLTGRGLEVTKEELLDLLMGRRLLQVVISGDNPVYLSVQKWDPARHSLCQKGDPSRFSLSGRLSSPDTLEVPSRILPGFPAPPEHGVTDHAQVRVQGQTSRTSESKASADCFYRYFDGDRQKTGLLWDKLKSHEQETEVKVIDASALVYFDEEKGKVYPRSLDFKLGIKKLRDSIGEGVRIVIVNLDERFNSHGITKALNIDGDLVYVIDIKGRRNFRTNILGAVNRRLGKTFKGEDLTIAYFEGNRTIFRSVSGARFIEVPDADNKNTFISGLGVLLAVLMEDGEFLKQLPYEMQEELRKVLIGERDGRALFMVSPQQMTKDYCRMLEEEHQRIDRSV